MPRTTCGESRGRQPTPLPRDPTDSGRRPGRSTASTDPRLEERSPTQTGAGQAPPPPRHRGLAVPAASDGRWSRSIGAADKRPGPTTRSPPTRSPAHANVVPEPDPEKSSPWCSPRWKVTESNTGGKKGVRRTDTFGPRSGRDVYGWQAAFKRDGAAGLDAPPTPPRACQLSRVQERQVLGWFLKSPQSFGFATDLWTGRRVAEVIRRKWGIDFNWRYLLSGLNDRDITSQKPQRRAREADQDAIDRWRSHEWPRLQHGRAANGPPLFSSTKAASCSIPSSVARCSSRSNTDPDRPRSSPAKRVGHGRVDAGSTSQSPRPLLSHPQGRLLPNRARRRVPSRSAATHPQQRDRRLGWVDGARYRGPTHRLETVTLPGYAPELNPVEHI